MQRRLPLKVQRKWRHQRNQAIFLFFFLLSYTLTCYFGLRLLRPANAPKYPEPTPRLASTDSKSSSGTARKSLIVHTKPELVSSIPPSSSLTPPQSSIKAVPTLPKKKRLPEWAQERLTRTQCWDFEHQSELEVQSEAVFVTPDWDSEGRYPERARRDTVVIRQWRSGNAAKEIFFDQDTITITTQLTINRLRRLEALAQKWDGPLSVAIWLCTAEDIEFVEAWWEEKLPESAVRRYVDLHLVLGRSKRYPANMLRNIARESMRRVDDTEDSTMATGELGWWLLVDSDVALSASMTELRADIRLSEVAADISSSVDAVFIIPAFELAPGLSFADGPAETSGGSIEFPRTKHELKELFQINIVQEMHKGRRSYSGPFSHSAWLGALEDECGSVGDGNGGCLLRYEAMFEPYYASRRKRQAQLPNERKWEIVRFDERFQGRGFNKQSHHFELWAAGYQYVVLPNIFLFDLPHEKRSWTQAEIGIQENQKGWINFRQEVATDYGLRCRESMWKRCDRRGQSCDKVCVRPSDSGGTHGRMRSRIVKENDRSEARAHMEEVRARFNREAAINLRDTKQFQHSASTSNLNSYEKRALNRWANHVKYMRNKADASKLNEIQSNPPASVVRALQSRCADGVDAVYTWVDGSDPAHQRAQREIIPEKEFLSEVAAAHPRRSRGSDGSVDDMEFVPAGHNLKFRFRDYGSASTLKYSIRSLEKHAPWIRHVWVVTADQTPEWLDCTVSGAGSKSKPPWVTVVPHWDIFRSDLQRRGALPTFNSCAIESQIHRIPGLAECYLYLNDDFLLLESLKLTDLWSTTEQLPYAAFLAEQPVRVGRDPWQRKVANVGRMFVRLSRRNYISIHPIIFLFKYALIAPVLFNTQCSVPKQLHWHFRSITMVRYDPCTPNRLTRSLRIPSDKQFLVGHHGHFFLKSIAEETEMALQSDYDRTALEQWRTPESLWVPFVYANLYAWRYPALPRLETSFYHVLTDRGGVSAVRRMFRALKEEDAKRGAEWMEPKWNIVAPEDSGGVHWLCLNDLLYEMTPEIEDVLVEGFQQRWPKPSRCELRD